MSPPSPENRRSRARHRKERREVAREGGVDFHVSRARPEDQHADPRTYFTRTEIRRYCASKSLLKTQRAMARRLVELLAEYEHHFLPSTSGVGLDVGCGPGFALVDLAGREGQWVGVDLLRPFVVHARGWSRASHPPARQVHYLEADAEALPFRSRAFAHLLSISALQWVFLEIRTPTAPVRPENRWRRVVTELARVLEDGGHIGVQVYLKSSRLMEIVGHLFRTPGGIEGGWVVDNPDAPRKRKTYLVGHRRSPSRKKKKPGAEASDGNGV